MSYKYNPRYYRKSYRWYRGNISSLKSGYKKMTPEIFRNMNKLYHYTSLNSGMLILLSRTFIMSHPSKMNDINESYRPTFSSGCEYKDVETEMKKYFQSSFTLDDGRVPGFAIPAMWGHYADKGRGMCLVFDKRKLLSRIESYGCYYGKIAYDKKYEPSIIVEDNPRQYIRRYIKDVFFTKSNDWAYEREFRVVCRAESKTVEIDLSDCIIGVIVYNFDDMDSGDKVISSPTYKNLVNRIKRMNIPVLALEQDLLNSQYNLMEYESNPDGEYWFPAKDNTQIVDII